MEKGKHDIGTPINESLEKHYQDEKKRLLAKISELEYELNETKHEVERLKDRVNMKTKQVEVLLDKLVEE